MEKIYKGKTIEDAVAKACKELGLTTDDFSQEVLELGAKGFLGIGSKDAVVKITYTPDVCQCVRDYLEGLFEKMGIDDVALDITLEKETVLIQVTGDNANLLMKNRGEGVDALQLLLSLIVNRDCGEYYKISFNVNDYKEKTKNRLEALAIKTATQVVKNRRKTTLPPMTSFQRRIIHAKLQDFEKVTTYSVGEDPNRRVVVSYTGEDGPAPRPNRDFRKGNRNDRGPRRDGNRGGKGGYAKRSDDRRPRREYVPEGEVYTGPITHLPGEKLSGSAAKSSATVETAGASASPVTGGTPFTMDSEN
ncbi:MAG: Jag N-terminal domain-containing protein [Clostridia bacterium]|nr:Jag N-terminal domain-containing protein [Clostridia bacterium]